jgi:hypothetical protein
MKKIVLFLFVSVLFSCNDDADSTNSTDTTSVVNDTSVSQTTTDALGKSQTVKVNVIDSNYKSWQITDGNIAREMIRRFNASCKHKHLDIDPYIKAQIDKAYPDALYDKKMVPAKHYKTSHDNYAKLRGIAQGDPKSRVNGFCTEIYWVLGRNKRLAETEEFYFDIATICPPPELERCDNKDTIKTNN